MKFDVNSFMHGALAQNVMNLNMDPKDVSDIGGYRDVKFEGVLCSATADSDTGERTFFTVDPKSGEALSSYTVAMPQLRFALTTEFPLTNETSDCPICVAEEKTKQKPDIVKVVRYFRRYNLQLEQIESSGGLTVGVLMDYKKGLMQIFPAFCAPTENFSREIGCNYVDESYRNHMGIQFEFDPDMSIKDNLVDALCESRVTWLTNDLNAIKIMARGFKNALNDPSDYIAGALE